LVPWVGRTVINRPVAVSVGSLWASEEVSDIADVRKRQCDHLRSWHNLREPLFGTFEQSLILDSLFQPANLAFWGSRSPHEATCRSIASPRNARTQCVGSQLNVSESACKIIRDTTVSCADRSSKARSGPVPAFFQNRAEERIASIRNGPTNFPVNPPS
jgi:hypothetical protein